MKKKSVVVGMLFALLFALLLPVGKARADEEKTIVPSKTNNVETVLEDLTEFLASVEVGENAIPLLNRRIGTLPGVRRAQSEGQYGYAMAFPEDCGTYAVSFDNNTKMMTLTAVPAPGCAFQCWLQRVEDEQGKIELKLYSWSQAISYQTPSEIDLIALFRRSNQYFAMYSVGNYGEITLSPDKSMYGAGDTISISAVAASGYRVGRIEMATYPSNRFWEVKTEQLNYTTISTDSSPGTATIQMPANDIQIRAIWYSNTLRTVKINPNITGGTVRIVKADGSLATEAQFREGDIVQLRITPDTGNYSKSISGVPSNYDNATDTFTMIDQDLTISVEFGKYKQYNLDFVVAPGSLADKADIYATERDGRVYVYAWAKYTNIEFDGWYERDQNGNETFYSDQNPLWITPERDMCLVGHFVQLYKVHITNPADGTVYVSPEKDWYRPGETITLDAVPNEGYEVYTYKKGSPEPGATQVSLSPFEGNTFVMPENSVYVTASFIPVYNIEASVNIANSGTVEGAGTYRYADWVYLTATPNEGYTFVNWTMDGQELSTSTKIKFQASCDRSLTANFKRNEYTVSVTADPSAGGTVSGGGTCYYGDRVTLNATSAEGYCFYGWMKNGILVETSESISFTVTESCSLVAKFERRRVYIDARYEGPYGTMKGGGYHYYGDTVTVSPDCEKPYRFVAWKENDVVVSTAASYSFVATKDRTLTPVFESVPQYTINTLVGNNRGGTVSGGGMYYEGDSVTLTATAAAGYCFVNWTENNAVISTNGTLKFTAAKARSLTANFEQILKITSDPVDVETTDDSAEFSVGVRSEGTLSYQWQYRESATSDWSDCDQPGAQTATLTVPVTSEVSGYQFRCVVNDSYNLTAVSAAATLTLKPRFTELPKDTVAEVGSKAVFSVAATGVAPLTYQWQAKAPGASSWSNSTQSGATTEKLSVATTVNHNGYLYRCVVSDSSGKKCYSTAATLTIKPKITSQPASKSVEVGDTATFTVAVNGKATLKYQWQAKAPGSSTWSDSTQSGATTAKLSVATNVNHNGYQYRCVVTDGNGKKAYSSAVTLTITPKITTQPSSKSVAVGNTATFTVAVNGKATLKYQWQAKAPGSNNWSNSSQSGATTKTLSVSTNENHNGYQYRCVVTDGNGKKAYSSAATLTIVPKITKQPASTSATVGSKATFTVAANGKATLKYQWQAKAPGSNTWSNSTQSGATTKTLSVSTTANHNGYQYRCVVTDGNGKKSYSSAATLYVLQITTQPTAKSVSAGTTVTFTVAATGKGTLTYQWQYKAPNATSWSNSTQSGATTAKLTIKTTKNHNGYQYRCVVKDSTDKKVTSNAAKLTVK